MQPLIRSLAALVALVLGAAAALAQSADVSTPVPPPLETAVANLVAANRILVDQGVLDAFGHVSVRHPSDPNRFLLSRNIAPALTRPEDILEYDLDSKPVDDRGQRSFLERFIHGEIYRARPDVNAVVHSHSPAVIPFGVSQVRLQAVYHMAGFLAAGVPVFEIRQHGGDTMLIGSNALGKALAETLADKSVALLRGHGNVVVGPSLPVAVYRAVYTEVNARLQAQAIALGGPINVLTRDEGEKIDVVQQQQVGRAWNLWKQKALAAP